MIIRSTGCDQIRIGKRGLLSVNPGWYLYVGSALGPGGVQARVLRHLRGSKKLHWHIDFLLASEALHVEEVWWTHSHDRCECQWGKSLKMLGTEVLISRFGASDCKCLAHLFYAFKLLSHDDLLATLEGSCHCRPIQSLHVENIEAS